MFDFVRNHQRLMQFVLLLFVFPSFVFGGIEAYSQFMNSPQDLIKVGKIAITQSEYDAVLNQQRERMREQMGSKFDAKLFDTPEMHQQILDSLVQKYVLINEAKKENLVIPDSALQSAILAMPEVTALRKADGSIDVDKYQEFLKAQGLTVDQFQANLRSNLLLQAIPAAVQLSGINDKTVSEKIVTLRMQEREVQELVFKNNDYVGRVNPTPEQIKAYYTSHIKNFEIPEQAKVEYVVLSPEFVQASVQVTDDDLKKAYEKNIAQYKVSEQRRASHILIAVAKDAPSAERTAAKEKAAKLLAEVRQNPTKFAEIAKQNSQDPGSADKGGDLGFFAKGAMTKPFEDAVFGMKEGQISDVVATDFGYHIIQVTGIKPAETKPFEAVKPDLEQEVKRQLSTRKFNELSEQFTNTVYEQADSLKPVVDKLKLQTQIVDAVTRNGLPALGPTHPLNNPKVLKALFDVDSIKNKRNIQAVSVNGNSLVSARLVEYHPATQRPFEAVQEQVKAAVIMDGAAALAKKDAEEKLTAVQKTGTDAGFGNAKWMSRTATQGLPPAIVDAVMKADISKLPTFVKVEFGQFGQVIFRIGKVQESKAADATQRQAGVQDLQKAAAQREFMSFYDAIKARADVKVIRSPTEEKAPSDGAKK